MKKSELINLRKMYVSELDRLNRIKELLNEETCKELINLSKLNVDEYKSIDNLKVLIDVLNKIKITQTNDIQVCTGTFITDCDICYQDTTWYTKAVPFDADYAEYRCYSDIENNHTIRAYTKPEFLRSYNPQIITSEFESKHIVLNPYNSNENDNGFNEVKNEFFMNCIDFGQAKSKRLILEKYKRM